VYLYSSIYAALIIVHLHGPRLFITALFQFAISASLLELLLVLLERSKSIIENRAPVRVL
jgi:hypothetical protein